MAPAALLLAFGMTTVLLNLHNVGLFPNNAMILGMGLFVGGLAQLFAGLLESKKGNTFGTTAFCAFGTFWLSLVAIWVLPEMGLAANAAWRARRPASACPWRVLGTFQPDAAAMSAYLAIWGLFTFGMFIGTFRLSHALEVVFGTLVALFWLLALADITGNAAVTQVAGAVGQHTLLPWCQRSRSTRCLASCAASPLSIPPSPWSLRGLRPQRLPRRTDRPSARVGR